MLESDYKNNKPYQPDDNIYNKLNKLYSFHQDKIKGLKEEIKNLGMSTNVQQKFKKLLPERKRAFIDKHYKKDGNELMFVWFMKHLATDVGFKGFVNFELPDNFNKANEEQKLNEIRKKLNEIYVKLHELNDTTPVADFSNKTLTDMVDIIKGQIAEARETYKSTGVNLETSSITGIVNLETLNQVDTDIRNYVGTQILDNGKYEDLFYFKQGVDEKMKTISEKLNKINHSTTNFEECKIEFVYLTNEMNKKIA
jgi:hypothetical protein